MSCKALPPSWDLAPGRKARNSHQWCAEGRITPMAHLASPKIILPHEQLVQRTNMIMEMEKHCIHPPLCFTLFDHLHPSDRTFLAGEMRFGWAGRGRRDTPRLLLFRLLLLLHLAKDSRQSTAKKKVKFKVSAKTGQRVD